MRSFVSNIKAPPYFLAEWLCNKTLNLGTASEVLI